MRFADNGSEGHVLLAALMVIVMLLLLSMALLHLAGQAARTALSRTRLLAIGADISVLRRLAGGEAALAVAVVGLGCTGVGAISSWMFVQKDAAAAVPYRTIGYVVVGRLLAAGLAGVAASSSVPGELRIRSRFD
jgi:hypothetical protein